MFGDVLKRTSFMLRAATLSLAVSLALCPAAPAMAGGDKAATPKAEPGTHQSLLVVSEAEGFPQVKTVRIGKNKALVVEVPRDLRDVVVSSPSVVDAVVQSSNRVHLIGKGIGQSNAFFFDANGEQILTLEISVEQDTVVLDQMFQRLIPGSNIKSEILNDTVILSGTVRTPVDANRARDIASRFITTADPTTNRRDELKVVNMLSVEGEEQVMLKIVVAEVQRELLKQFGINIAADINAGNFAVNVLTANALPLTAAAGLGSLPVPGAAGADNCATLSCFYNDGPNNSAGDATYGNSGVTDAWSTNNNRVGKAMRALERDGLVKTLAEPNLTAISGEPAKFLAGGRYPIPTIDPSTGAMGVTQQEFGVKVAFTPIVLSEGRISLKIESEVSELTNAGAVTINSVQIPALRVRQANSTVELPSGGSIALAGLISDDLRQNVDGFPGLKDMPILGTLFRSRDFVRRETELVVIVTPYLVKPVSQQQLSKPTDGLMPASDFRANFMGQINEVYGRRGGAPAGDLKGDYGFIVE